MDGIRRRHRLLGSALVAIGLITVIPASADPAQDDLARYRDLSIQAEKLNEDYLAAKEDLGSKQQELDRINIELSVAIQNQVNAQTETDKFINLTFTTGASLTDLSAILSSKSQKDLLDASSYIRYIADDKNKALDELRQTKNRVDDLQHIAQKAKDDASKLVTGMDIHKRDLDTQILNIRLVGTQLTIPEKAQLQDRGNPKPNVAAPTSAAQTAINAALSKLGSPYVWGATGPNTFDCSGLTQWAYKQAGITLPRVSRDQGQFGQLILASQLQPGDLVFFGVPIHHVGMYLGNGQMIHAPDTGDVVKISKLQSPLVVARRVT